MDESINPLPNGYPSCSLHLADGARWRIQAGDTGAIPIVTAVAGAMQLGPVPARRPVRELTVLTVESRPLPPVNLAGPGPAVCMLPPPAGGNVLATGLMQLALAIAREALDRGGLLIHGALALPPGARTGETAGGVILAGPGTVGKSTACRRLPPPWHPLCDDQTLVVRDARGTYWAHPWPTWSLFYENGPGGAWETEKGVPLRALYFLNQAPDDRVEPLNVARATASLFESVQQVSEAMAPSLSDSDKQALRLRQLDAASTLARAVPAFLLHLSLEGTFWRQIEQALPEPMHEELPAGAGPPVVPDPGGGGESLEWGPPGTFAVVYTGPSMNPTLAEPDVLTVRPYGNRPVRPGDVVCFRPPGEERRVVHRVVRVAPAGIRTRGDNNLRADTFRLQPDDILGRVVAAQRGRRRRQIAGGRCGQIAAARAGIWRLMRAGSGRLLHGTYRFLAETGPFRRWLPSGLRPRLLRFQNRRHAFFKLTMGGRLIGRYDPVGREWHIRRPFRLWVDEAALPRSRKRKAPLGPPPPESAENGRRRDPSRYWANPDVVCREGNDGWATLISSDTNGSLALNPTGLAVWRLVNGRRSAGEIAAAVRRHFHDVPEGVADDVTGLLDILAEDGFIGEQEPDGHKEHRSGRLNNRK